MLKFVFRKKNYIYASLSKNELQLFYSALQTNIQDFRDKRGQHHELAFVIILFVYAMMRTDKKLTSATIHRKMVENQSSLLALLELNPCPSISYSPLKRILRGLCFEELNTCLCNFLGIKLEVKHNEWDAVEGKELRGSMDGVQGEKRGENIISLASHQGARFKIIKTYHGNKESEMTLVKDYFQKAEKLVGH
jgi:hypothetical protein